MFTVQVADNFHYGDKSEIYTHGEFATWEDALAAARRIVDDSLAHHWRQGISADELYDQYQGFGDDPFIVPEPEGRAFSAWDYARERCAVLCGWSG